MNQQQDATWRKQRMERIRAADELALYNALSHICEAVQSKIVLDHKGTADLKEHLVGMTKRMRKAMQLAVVEGGRDAFTAETANWSGFVLYDDFMSRLDHYLTRLPVPRKRREQPPIPPR